MDTNDSQKSDMSYKDEQKSVRNDNYNTERCLIKAYETVCYHQEDFLVLYCLSSISCYLSPNQCKNNVSKHSLDFLNQQTNTTRFLNSNSKYIVVLLTFQKDEYGVKLVEQINNTLTCELPLSLKQLKDFVRAVAVIE